MKKTSVVKMKAHSRKLRDILGAANRRINEGKGIGHEQFWADVESTNRTRRGSDLKKTRRPKSSATGNGKE